MTSPAAPRSSSRNAQRCSESKTAASPSQTLQKHRISFKRSSSASTPSSSIRRGFAHLHAGSAVFFFPLDSCTFPVAIYYSRIFPIFSSESFEFCWPLSPRSRIVFSWRAPSQSHERGRFPHHLLLIISVAYSLSEIEPLDIDASFILYLGCYGGSTHPKHSYHRGFTFRNNISAYRV